MREKQLIVKRRIKGKTTCFCFIAAFLPVQPLVFSLVFPHIRWREVIKFTLHISTEGNAELD